MAAGGASTTIPAASRSPSRRLPDIATAKEDRAIYQKPDNGGMALWGVRGCLAALLCGCGGCVGALVRALRCCVAVVAAWLRWLRCCVAAVASFLRGCGGCGPGVAAGCKHRVRREAAAQRGALRGRRPSCPQCCRRALRLSLAAAKRHDAARGIAPDQRRGATSCCLRTSLPPARPAANAVTLCIVTRAICSSASRVKNA